MTVFQIIALMLTMAAIFSFLNYKTLKLPTTIGLMFFSLLMSLADHRPACRGPGYRITGGENTQQASISTRP